ncbi:MAG: hypothetical protein MI922_19815, partial [Bacteroidales bacterium]|nr:hypothetical protein [Bacteroidales bacterium]
SFINHRESESNGKLGANTTFKNIYIQGQLHRFICLNGLDKPITYSNLRLENITLENIPKSYNWIYANAANNNTTSIEIIFKNVRFGNRFIKASDFKTKGTTNFTFNTNGIKYTGYMNPSEQSDCSCPVGNEFHDINDLNIETTSCTQAVLKWTDNNTGESGYRIRRKVASSSTYTTLGDIKANAQTYIDSSVKEGVTYIYQVRALDNGVAATNSNTPGITIPNCPTVTIFKDITDLEITGTACNQVVLSWTDNCTGESGFRIRRKVASESTFTTLGDVDADEQTYTDNSVIDGTTYIYQVRALDNGVAATISNTPQVTTPNCLNDITDLSITDTACNMVVLNWTDNCTGESGFRVYRKISKASNYTPIEDVAADVKAYTDSSVIEGETYIYQVRALDNGVAATNSNTPQITIPNCPIVTILNDITDLAIMDFACNKVVLSWTDNCTGESGFRIRRKVASESAFTTLGDVDADEQTYTDNSVIDGTT